MLLSRLTSGEYFEYYITAPNGFENYTIIFHDVVFILMKFGDNDNFISKYCSNLIHINTENNSDIEYKKIVDVCSLNIPIHNNVDLNEVIARLASINRKNKLKRLLSC